MLIMPVALPYTRHVQHAEPIGHSQVLSPCVPQQYQWLYSGRGESLVAMSCLVSILYLQKYSSKSNYRAID